MVDIGYKDGHHACQTGESVLDCLTRDGVEVASSCRTGVCQSCLMKVVEGPVPQGAQTGLKPSWQRLGLILACQARPVEPLTVDEPGAAVASVDAALVERRWPAPDVVVLRLRVEAPTEARAGQYFSLVRPDGVSRPYSLASVPGAEGEVELHVRVLEDGLMSRYLAHDLEPGQSVALRGPHGECFYVEGSPEQPLLLVGTGTGLAPLLGIARDALGQGHTGPIHLIHGARSLAGLYGRQELEALAARHANLTVTLSALEGHDPGVRQEPIAQVVKALGSLGGHRVFLCGAPDMVRALRRQCFMAGASMAAIHADAFLTRADAGR